MNVSYGEAYAVRSAAILTNAYVAGTILGVKNNPVATNAIEVAANPLSHNQLEIWAAFTKGSLTSASIKVEFSWDESTWFQETFSSISGGTDTLSAGVHTMSADGNYRFSIPFKAKYVRISAIGTGTVTSSSLAITAILGLV